MNSGSLLNNERIAKNTFLLYLRMVFIMAVQLYTSRIVLGALGLEDFGLYNVVAGLVLMLTFLNGAMSNATQRFLSYELVKNNVEELRNVFCQIQIIHIGIAIIVLFLGETIGLWFINFILNITENRMFAANVVYQCSLLSAMFTIISVPYNSVLIAHENMKLFAWIGLVEGCMKLIICFILFVVSSDKLIIYGISLTIVSISIRLLYWRICHNYEETRYNFIINKEKLKEIGLFALWSLCGSISTLASTQGANILINIFFSTIVNASIGIAYQVNSAVRSFVMNFQTAINPQIVKSYSLGNLDKMHFYIYMGSKLSFFILYLLSIPIIFNLPIILHLWLGNVPNDAIIFTRFILINSLIVSLSGVLSISAQATGKIKTYQLTMGGGLLLNLPISALLFVCGSPAYSVFIVSILIEQVLLFLRLFFLREMIFLSIIQYIKKVLLPIFMTVGFSVLLCYAYYDKFYKEDNFNFVVSCIFYGLITVMSIFFVGLKNRERHHIIKMIKVKRFAIFNKTVK